MYLSEEINKLAKKTSVISQDVYHTLLSSLSEKEKEDFPIYLAFKGVYVVPLELSDQKVDFNIKEVRTFDELLETLLSKTKKGEVLEDTYYNIIQYVPLPLIKRLNYWLVTSGLRLRPRRKVIQDKYLKFLKKRIRKPLEGV